MVSKARFQLFGIEIQDLAKFPQILRIRLCEDWSSRVSRRAHDGGRSSNRTTNLCLPVKHCCGPNFRLIDTFGNLLKRKTCRNNRGIDASNRVK